MDALAVLRSAEVPLALVHDEYGHLDGIVTPARSFPRWLARSRMTWTTAMSRPASSVRTGAGWCRARPMPTCCRIGIGVSMPGDRDYSTVAGFALSVLKKIPETGEVFKFDGFRFEVVDMDGRKIDKLLVSRPKRRKSEQEAGSESPSA